MRQHFAQGAAWDCASRLKASRISDGSGHQENALTPIA